VFESLQHGDFSILQDGGRRHLGFLNFMLFLKVVTVKSAELRHYAKFYLNCSNRGRDITVFGFCKMASAVILDFKNFTFLTVGTVKRLKLHNCQIVSKSLEPRPRYCDFSILKFGGRRHLVF